MARLLVVVDYQNDFVDGALGFKGAESIEDEIIGLIIEFRLYFDQVVFTYDTHDEDYLNTVEGQNLPVKHCIKDTEGWKLRHPLDKWVGESPVFYKSGFGSKELGDYIAKNNFDEIYLCGLVSDICVFSNAIIAKAAASPYTKIKVVRKATASFDPEMQEKAFDVLKHLHIEII